MALISVTVLALAVTLMVQSTFGQSSYPNPYYRTSACGAPLTDIPNPASDSCVSFFRCYQFRQYSVRCPAGQAFDFDRARCRPANLVDCPLQLQRFQAPGVPSYLRPASSADDNPVEIRVIQMGASNNPNGLVFLDNNGQQVPVTRQSASPQAAQSQVRSHPVNPYLTQPVHQNPVAQNRGQTLFRGPFPSQVQPQSQSQGQPQAQAQAQAQAPATNANGNVALSLGQ